MSFTDLGAISSESATNSGEDSGTYTDLSNPNQQESPENSANPTVGTTAPTAPTNLSPGSADTVELRYIGSRGTIITNPDGSLGMFLSGSWPSDGDSDAFNQIFYTSSTDGGQTWSVPKVVLSTEYEFNASREQDEALAKGKDEPLGISAYYSGRAYGPAVVQNPNGSLTMVFSGYRLPKPVTSVGTELGTGASKYKIGAKDPAIYRNILTMHLASATSPGVATSTSVSASDEGTGIVGAPVTYTATVAPQAPGTGTPTGKVSFSDSHGPIAGCAETSLNDGSPDTATCATTHGPAGSDEVTATYAGDSNYAGSSGETTENVQEAPAITSADEDTFGEGAEGSFPVTATGTPTPTITESGTLPEGVKFNAATATLEGTPTQTGVYSIEFTAANGVGSNAVQRFTLTVNEAPAITSADEATFTEGGYGSFPVTASGFPSPGLSESGEKLPHGLTFEPFSGTLSGIPTQEGVYHIIFEATNGVGANAVQQFTLTVDAPPAIASASDATFTYGVPGSFTVKASGTPSPFIEEWGNLPEGVSYSDGVLSGTPTQIGTFKLTFTAENGIGADSVQRFTLTVLGLHVTTSSLPEAAPRVAYSQQLQAVGGIAPYKWRVTAGSLPAGLRLSSTGVLEGKVKPSVGAGSFPITVKVTDHTPRVHQTASATFTLLVS